MADNLTTQTAALATVPSASVIATDQLGTGEHVQFMKLMDGTLDSTNKAIVSAGGALKVDGSAVTQPVSGTVGVSGTVPVSGPLTDAQLRAVAVPVSGTFFQATQPVSIAATVGVSGPLTDTQLRATAVPVSGPVTDAQIRATPLPVSGTVTVTDGAGALSVDDNAGSLTVDAPVGTPVFTRLSDGAAALVGQKVMASSLPVAIASDQSAVPISHANLDVALSTRLKPADTLAGVTTVAAVTAITNALPAGTNKLGTVDIATAAATAKATQGANGVPTQDLKDAGRSARTITLDSFAVAATAETLMTMSYSTDNGALTTGTSYAVTAGKRLRVQSIMATLHTIAGNTTAVAVIIRIRVNNAGAAIVSSPVQAVLAVQGVAAANQAGIPVDIPLPDGWEFVAGAGIAVTVACPGFVATTAAPKVDITITGYEY